jgi:nucleoside 2-deoxyribosyltransferase
MRAGTAVKCPVCSSANGVRCVESQALRDSTRFDCEACGEFEISRHALVTYFKSQSGSLTTFQRAALSHLLNSASQAGGGPMISMDWMERFVGNARLPSPPKQATNLIRLIGNRFIETGEGYVLDSATDTPRVGALNANMFSQLCKELEARNLIQAIEYKIEGDSCDDIMQFRSSYGLTLDGWERYEAEQSGRVAGRNGFIAMKFGDEILDLFLKETIKPAIKDGIGYDLVDLRDVSRAGVIDNIMREQIRDAAFVLVDLTHDNSGAYWEAGYAEGLGKPVVYLCERAKFDNAKTHFDTNHCTTVLWSAENPKDLRFELIATLRRSLNLFAPAS